MAGGRNEYCVVVYLPSQQMGPRHHAAAQVVCEECQFSTTVRDDDDRLPADVVREHGRETGHKLSVTFPEG